jgi:outer membrane protein OmpA-like peptidoglycan-associated protein
MELGLHSNSGLGDTVQEAAVIGIPMGVLGGFAASISYVDNGTFQGRDAAGGLTGNYSAGDMGGSIGWGKQLFHRISVGAAAKYNQQTLAGTSYGAYSADLGLLWNAFSRFNLGLTYSNLGTDVASSFIYSGWRAGASYGLNNNILLAVSGDMYSDGIFSSLQLGFEDYVTPKVAIRVGYLYSLTDQFLSDTQLDGTTGLTAGIGVKVIKNMTLDYAYIPYGDLGISQRLSITFKFPCNAKYVEPKPQPVVEVIPAPVVVAPKPVPVEAQNVIVLEKLIVLEDTHFNFDSSKLTKDGENIVAENAQLLKDNPDAKIRVAGYTSCSGTPEYNQKLSERRALSVKNALLEAGIAQDRVTTIGYGATKPAEYEAVCKIIDSKAAKANMRVLFEVMTK